MSSANSKNQKIVDDRIKHGQCVYCGTQTHKVVRKWLKPTIKIPLTMPKLVQNGACLRPSCQAAGCMLNSTTTTKTSNSSSSTGMKVAVGVTASLGGAVLSGLGVPVLGEVVTEVGNMVLGSAQSNLYNHSSLNLQQLQQQNQQNMQQYLQQLQAVQQQSLQQLQQFRQQNQQNLHQAVQQLRQQTQCQSPQGVSVLQPIKRPRQHTAAPSVGMQCDICGQSYMNSYGVMRVMMAGCRACDWAICSPCANVAVQGSSLAVCPANHKAYWVTLRSMTSCSHCFRVLRYGEKIYYCRICNWISCCASPCGDRGTRAPAMKCPRKHLWQRCLCKGLLVICATLRYRWGVKRIAANPVPPAGQFVENTVLIRKNTCAKPKLPQR